MCEISRALTISKMWGDIPSRERFSKMAKYIPNVFSRESQSKETGKEGEVQIDLLPAYSSFNSSPITTNVKLVT